MEGTHEAKFPSKAAHPEPLIKAPACRGLTGLLYCPLRWQDPPCLSLWRFKPSQVRSPRKKITGHCQLLHPALTHFYKLLSPRSSQKGNQGHSGPPAAGSGHSGIADRCSRCRGGQLHSGGTEGGSLRGQGGTERRHRCCERSISFLH